MKYTFTITGDASREKIILESREGESDQHIALKIIAYSLYRDKTDGIPLKIEYGVDQRHKPDLVATVPDTEQVRLWIDCGQIEPKRLERIVTANRTAQVVVVKATRSEMEAYARSAAKNLPPKDRSAQITYISFDDGFIAEFVERLRGTNEMSVSGDPLFGETEANTERAMTLTLNGETLETSLYMRGS